MGNLPQTGVELVIKGLTAFLDGMAQGARAVTGFGQSAGETGQKSSFFGDIATGAFRQVGAIATNALFGLQGQMISLGKQSIDLASQFEAGINGLASVAGDALPQAGYSMDDVRTKALQLGADTQFSASQALDALTELVKGGVDMKTVMNDGTDAVLSLAAAAGIQMTDAATIVAKSLGTWADKGVTATDITNTFSQAVNASVLDAHELSLAMFNSQGAAKSMGASYQDLNALLAQVSKGFNSGAEAGTAVKYLYNSLIPATKKATDAMQSLGLVTADGANTFFDAQGKFIGTRDAIDKIQKAFAGLDAQTRTSLARDMFGQEALSAVNILIDEGAEGFDKMRAGMDAAGTAADQTEKKNKGLAFSMEQMRGSLETVQIILASLVLPTLSSFLDTYITPGINLVGQLAQALTGSKEAFEGLPAPIQQVITVVDAVVQGFGEGGLQGALAQLVPGLEGVGSATSDLSSIWEEARGIADKVWQGVKDITASVLPILENFYKEHGQEFSSTFKTAYDTVIDIIHLGLALYNEIVPPALQAVANFIKTHGKEITLVLEGAWALVQGIVKGGLQIVRDTIKLVLDIVKGNWKEVWNDVVQLAQNFVINLVGIVEGLDKLLRGAVKMVLDGFREAWNAFADWSGLGGGIVDGIIQGLFDKAEELYRAAAKLAEDAWKAAKEALGMQSPSRVFRLLGRGIPTSTALGVEDTTEVLNQSVVRAMVRPVASVQQIFGAARASNNTTTFANTFNMPVYTNQSPTVVQQGFRTMQAIAGV